MTTAIVNKKATIFGEDDQSAELTGDSSVSQSNSLGGSMGLNNTNFPAFGNSGTSEIIVASRSAPVTNSKNVIFIRASSFTGTNGRTVTFRLRENNTSGTILSSVIISTIGESPSSTQAVEWIMKPIVVNASLSVSSIVLTRQTATPPSFGTQGSYAFDVWTANLVDTHVASLTGDNTQRTVENQILS